MEIRADKFINELATRTIQNYEYVKKNSEKEGLFEVTQLINSMYCLIVVPEEVFGYKSPYADERSVFETREKNLKKYESYHEIVALINELEQQNRIKYKSIDEYVQKSPVSCMLYHMRNALCHENVGFLPITSSDGKNKITDIIFRTGKGKNTQFMMVLKVEQLERLLTNVANFYSDIENGKANSDNKTYRDHYLRLKSDLTHFIGEYRQ